MYHTYIILGLTHRNFGRVAQTNAFLRTHASGDGGDGEILSSSSEELRNLSESAALL